MARRLGHPSTHGHHVNPHTCGASHHNVCDGFSGGYDTYVCGCCCHDLHTDPKTVTDADRAWIERVRAVAKETGEEADQ
ncbi:hypothetical protein [Amycolatopsis sp. NPDC001319]|uniref:hypothetical protein n=1 Tax=unclassified Amycolatopsis TaxID=2618356 RepID=UPI0036CCB006